MANEMLTSEATVRALENELHVDIIPGTEIMAQVAGVHFVESGRVVLVPQPTNNADDPLNWNRLWKGLIMASMVLTSFTQAFGPLSVAPQVPHYMQDFHRDLADILQFTGICILVLGFSNFIWVPIATIFGRRPALLISGLVAMAGCIWRATATSYESFIGACVIHGIGAGTVETLPPMIIADVMFLHERGFWMNVYTWAYFGTLMIGPIVSGPMSDRFGWQSFWWLNVALYAFVFVFQLFLFPETKYNRQASGTFPESDNTSTSEKAVQAGAATASEEEGKPTSRQQDHVDQYLYKGSPARWQFFEPKIRCTMQDAINSIWIPVYLFAFPIIQWSSFVLSWSASCFLVVNLTQSQAFAAPPYNFSSSAVGLTNFAPFVGATFGMVTAGPLSDWFSMRLTRRNRGIREPEMRLPTLLPYVVCTLVGSLVVAIGYQRQWRWEVIVIIGYTLLGVQVSAVPAISTTYAIDSYKPVAGEFLVSATVNKNLWGYGLSKFLTPWILKDGFVPPQLTNMALCLFFISFAIPLFFFGKHVRRWSRNSFVHRRK